MQTADNPTAQPSPRARALAGRAFGVLRTHWIFVVALALGALLRLVTQLAYRPALIFFDSSSYLNNTTHLAPTGFRPLGYPLFLAPLLHLHDLTFVPLAQHLIALAAAVLLYATLVRLGLWRWLATLGALPFLVDGYQLNIEQWVMSDTLFEVLLIIAFCALLWNRRPGWIACIVAGAALAFGVWVRFAGIFMIVPAGLFLLFALPDWRRRLTRLVAIAVAFALPIAGYGVWYDVANGQFKISSSSGPILYARAASFVDCSGVSLPKYEQPLCPTEPVNQRMPTNCFAWCPASPATNYTPPPGMNKQTVLNDFAKRVFKAEPLRWAQAVAGDFLHGFQWGRSARRQDIPLHYWRFTVDYPSEFSGGRANVDAARWGGPAPISHPTLSRSLVTYQGIVNTQGPFLALGLVLGLLGAVGIGRARRSGLRSVAFVWAAGGLAATVITFATSQFTYRYQMPLVIFYPVAGAVGLFALLGGTRPGTGRPDADAVPTTAVDPRTTAGTSHPVA